MGVTTPPRGGINVQKTSDMPPTESINRRRPGCKEQELIFGTWNVRTLFKTGALLSLSTMKQNKFELGPWQLTKPTTAGDKRMEEKSCKQR